MALIYCGIDEAGYGPMLGPLCVGLTCFRVDSWSGEHVPDLWETLNAGVCRSLKELRADKRGKVAIADSKQLKLSNQLKTKHPLVHLERTALALLAAAGVDVPDDSHLFSALGAQLPDQPWYAGDPTPMPIGNQTGEICIATNVLGSALGAAGVHTEELATRVVSEQQFNDIVKETGTKSEATISAIGQHLRTIETRWKDSGEDIRIVCDRLGARKTYKGMLQRELPGTQAIPLYETPERSIYKLEGWAGDTKILFETEAENAHLPVACASIYAKLTRELAMARLNRYFRTQLPELKPTAGYYTDARRWLEEAAGALDGPTRNQLIRRG
jgi:ribonuclease HII